MTVDRLSAEHIPAVAEMEKLCFSEPWSEKSLGILTGDGAVGFVALEDGQVTAYVGMMLVLDEGQITNVATHPDYRRKGYAEAVLDRLIAYSQAAGVSEIFLEVRRSNNAAIKLYEKMGFETVGMRKGFYRAPTEDAILMKKTLPKEK
jgi:ribosomal-protein-alanine N-acetyltransferase